METKSDRTGRTIAALFASSFLILMILTFLGDESAYERAEAALRSASIDPVYSIGDEAAVGDIFIALIGLPFVFAGLYAFGIKWSRWFFIFSFIAFVFSPIYGNPEGIEVYTSVDIIAEAVIAALGGMLCLQMATGERVAAAARGGQVDAGS